MVKSNAGPVWSVNSSGEAFYNEGNVGIGIDDPLNNLHVYDATGNVTVRIETGDASVASFRLDNSAQAWQFQNNGSNSKFTIRDSTNSKSPFTIESNTPANMLYIATSGIAVNNSSPETSAIMDIESTSGALLVPRMTTTQRDALTAVNGMIIYNSTTNQMQGYINGSWSAM